MKTKFDMLEELKELIGTEFDENVIYDIFDTDFEEFEKWNVDDWDVIIDEDRDEISDYTIYVNNSCATRFCVTVYNMYDENGIVKEIIDDVWIG